MTRALVEENVFYEKTRKTCFRGGRKSCFSGITFFMVDQGNVVNVRFVAHRCLLPNLSRLNYYDPGLTTMKNDPAWTHTFLTKPTSFYSCWIELILVSCTSICYSLIPSLTDTLWPAKLKNGHFRVSFGFFGNYIAMNLGN